MSETLSSFSARRAVRRGSIIAVLSLAACTFLPREASAATARVRWLPSASGGIVRYDVYVRNGGGPYGAAAWSGNPAPSSDGALEALVPFAAAMSGVNYFAVVAVDATGESVLSHELPVGTPVPCRIDSCTSKTSCDFGDVPDGTLCDVADTDPCSAVCVAGTCGTTSGVDTLVTDVTSARLRFTSRDSSVKLSLKGKLVTDAALDPTSTGAVLELRGADGTQLFASSIAAGSFVATRSGQRFRFHASKTNRDAAWNGVAKLDFRRSGSQWIVTAQALTPALAQASVEPAITLVLRLGASCIRRVGAACDPKPPVSICR